MTACDRCGRDTALQRAFDGQHCAVCLDWYREHPGRVRDAGQRSLGAFADE